MSESPLRILHVTEVHWGGVVSLLVHFVEEQVAAGHEVHVLAHADLPPMPAGVTVHRWDVDRGRPVSLLKAVRQVRSTISEVGPDVVHLHSFFAGLLGRLPLGLSGTRGTAVVYQPHAWSDQLSNRRWVNRGVRSSERLSARATDLIVANGPDELTRGAQIGVRAPGIGVGVAVDLEVFHPPTAEERTAARAELGLGEERVALILGRLIRQKGQDLLLPEWEKQHPDDTTLALVGPGDTEWLAGLAPSQWGRSVVAYGETDRALAWLWAADVMVLCSRYEGLPIVVAEAMAVGLPVVTTAVDGVRGILTEGDEPVAGVVVPLGDMRRLIAELARRLDDPDLRASESVAGPLRSESRFTPAAVTERLVSAYRDAIRRARAVPNA